MNSDRVGRINVKTIHFPRGVVHYQFSLEGGPFYRVTGEALLRFCGQPYSSLSEGYVFTLGPFRLRMVRYLPQREEWLCTLDGWRGRFYAARERLAGQWFRLIGKRLLLTAAVWGLARWPREGSGEQITWALLKRPWRRG